ncbi:hypothetical protein W822_20145 [Advenella kashmirensis W13003]|uniref:Uncharacterized protein n=1 Tax=Advenella kashmirensis W13003 TaxID=1424334 RepID=V8QMR1_9BURK|nr:hypothetical protein [Advenella kashmirensis]ETF00952.1 hypothetical protein W822_20145 [Advenella kashmirensis W13003]
MDNPANLIPRHGLGLSQAEDAMKEDADLIPQKRITGDLAYGVPMLKIGDLSQSIPETQVGALTNKRSLRLILDQKSDGTFAYKVQDNHTWLVLYGGERNQEHLVWLAIPPGDRGFIDQVHLYSEGKLK